MNADTGATATFGPAPTSSYAQVVKGDAPAGYWRLDETTGTTAADSAGTNPGTYQGPPTLGVAGLIASTSDKAASFSGTNQSVRIPTSSALSPTAKVSVEAWIKPAALPATGAFASVASKAESYSLQLNGPKMEFTIIQSGTRRRLQAPAGAIAVGKTYHVVGTYDGATQRLYVNGALVASAALTGAISTTTNSVYIGSWNGGQEFFNGVVDEVAIYPGALSAAQVSNHYSSGTTVTTALVRGAPTAQLVAQPLAAGVVRTVAVGGSTPVAVAVDSALHHAYVTRNEGFGLGITNGLTVLDTRTWRVLGQVTTSPSAGPSSVAVNPVTHLVYVTSAVYAPGSVRGRVTVVDGRTDRIVGSLPTGPGPKAVAVNPRTNRVYVTEQTGTDSGEAVAVIDGSTRKLLATVPIGAYDKFTDNPFGLVVDATTNRVYASNPLEGTVSTLDGRTNTIIRSVAIGEEPAGLALNPAIDALYVDGSHGVTVIDTRTGGVLRRISLGDRTRGIAVDARDNTVYVSTDGGRLVAISHGVPAVVDSSVKPYGLGVSDGAPVVANAFSSTVSVLTRGATGDTG
jgi:YVTN family beta-propeller protein